jgi:hypothetical protein
MLGEYTLNKFYYVEINEQCEYRMLHIFLEIKI